jgi:hypothetical protein
MNTRTTWREEEALWRLIQGFFASAARERGLTHCRGFSRQAMGDIAAAFSTRGVRHVCRLRGAVRDLVEETAQGEVTPLKITSTRVRPYLETILGQTRADRDAYVLAWVNRQFEAMGVVQPGNTLGPQEVAA